MAWRADYNGKNKFVLNGGINIEINTDYQVPSARVSYIWDQIFSFAGFTYSGSFFATQDFLNLFMTFPKPVPTLVPNKILLHSGQCYPRSSLGWSINEVGPGVNGLHTYYLLTIPRENFTNPYAENTTNLDSPLIPFGGYIYARNYIKILTAGSYTIDIPLTVNATYFRIDFTNTIVESGIVIPNVAGTLKSHLFVCNVGDKIGFLLTDPEPVLSNLYFDWELNRIDGFEADFGQNGQEIGTVGKSLHRSRQIGIRRLVLGNHLSKNRQHLTEVKIIGLLKRKRRRFAELQNNQLAAWP